MFLKGDSELLAALRATYSQTSKTIFEICAMPIWAKANDTHEITIVSCCLEQIQSNEITSVIFKKHRYTV